MCKSEHGCGGGCSAAFSSRLCANACHKSELCDFSAEAAVGFCCLTLSAEGAMPGWTFALPWGQICKSKLHHTTCPRTPKATASQNYLATFACSISLSSICWRELGWQPSLNLMPDARRTQRAKTSQHFESAVVTVVEWVDDDICKSSHSHGEFGISRLGRT